MEKAALLVLFSQHYLPRGHQWTRTHTLVQDCGIRNTHPEITQLFIPFFTLCKSSCTGPRDQGSCPSLYSQSLGHEKDSVSQSDTREKGRLWLAQAEWAGQMTTKREVWNCRKKAVKNGWGKKNGWGNTYICFSSLLKYNKNNNGKKFSFKRRRENWHKKKTI